QITWRPIALQVKLKVQPTVTSDNSTTTSQSPRLTRKTRQLRLASPARRPEIRPGASQKDEARRAEVGDPAGKEEKRRGAGEIARLEQPGIEMKKLADMIEGHDHHDQPADEVDRVESRRGRAQPWATGDSVRGSTEV